MSDASNPRRRFVRRDTGNEPSLAGAVPDEIIHDPLLNAAVDSLLPSNYNFEIHKTVHHIRKNNAQCVALQMPEGLTLWSTAICDIIERYVASRGGAD